MTTWRVLEPISRGDRSASMLYNRPLKRRAEVPLSPCVCPDSIAVLCPQQRPPSSSLSYGGAVNDDVRSPGSGGTPGPLSQPPPQTLDATDPGNPLSSDGVVAVDGAPLFLTPLTCKLVASLQTVSKYRAHIKVEIANLLPALHDGLFDGILSGARRWSRVGFLWRAASGQPKGEGSPHIGRRAPRAAHAARTRQLTCLHSDLDPARRVRTLQRPIQS
ncbi:unnamed protein product, partial [Iphiclides podalirius]